MDIASGNQHSIILDDEGYASHSFLNQISEDSLGLSTYSDIMDIVDWVLGISKMF